MAAPLRIRFREERHAVVLADELAGLTPEVSRNGRSWEVSIDDPQTKDFLISTLEAIRQTLIGQPSATAEVDVNGDTYQMFAEIPDGRR